MREKRQQPAERFRLPRILKFFACASFSFLLAWPAAATIRYQISLAHPERHLFHVTMDVPAGGDSLVVAIPAWNTLYQVRDFAYRVRQVEARLVSAGSPAKLPAEKLDTRTWKITLPSQGEAAPAVRGVEITYAIQWDEPGPFGSQLNAHHAFLDLAEILFYIPDRRGEDVSLHLADIPGGWKTGVELSGSGDSFSAASYDQLVDAPMEIGTFQELDFTESQARYRVVVDGPLGDRGKFEDALHRIVAYETHLMNGAPFPEYLFIFHFGAYGEVGGGGMEHSASTAIAVDQDASATMIAAHEFFHVWNVKRIRPQALEPVDYAREQPTRALWFAEGVTSTYGYLALTRTGLWPADEYLYHLAAEITELESRPARQWQSVEESSLDAWFEKYDAYLAPNRSISYYNKGEIVGVLLDLRIRDATNNRKSLDDVMRSMNDRFARRGHFYNESADIRAVAESVCSCDLNDVFRRYVSGTEDIPYAEFFSPAGLDLKVETQTKASAGFEAGVAPGVGSSVAAIDEESPAYQAGLRQGDGLVSLEGESFPLDMASWLQSHNPGAMVLLHFRRGGEEKRVRFALGTAVSKRFGITEVASPGERQRRIRNGFLRGTTD